MEDCSVHPRVLTAEECDLAAGRDPEVEAGHGRTEDAHVCRCDPVSGWRQWSGRGLRAAGGGLVQGGECGLSACVFPAAP